MQTLKHKTEEGSFCEMIYTRQSRRQRTGAAGTEDWRGTQRQMCLRNRGQEDEDAVCVDENVEHTNYTCPAVAFCRETGDCFAFRR